MAPCFCYLYLILRFAAGTLMCVLHTITGIRSNIVFDIAFAQHHTEIGVQLWTMIVSWTLAQYVCVDFIEQLLPFTHCKQFAWLLSLALQSLWEKIKVKNFNIRSRKKWKESDKILKEMLTLCGEQANKYV